MIYFRLKIIFALTLALFLLVNIAISIDKKAILEELFISVDGDKRSYWIYIPSNINTNKPSPVIFNFHGGGGNAHSQINYSKMNDLADKYGIIIVYPEGTPSMITDKMRTWNAGSCCGKAKRLNVDDTEFVRYIIKDITSKFNIDKNKIYSTGMSNGGLISYKLACELSDQIAAVAPVAGTDNTTSCNPSRPISIIHFHGTDDEFCKYNGGVGEKSISSTNFNSVSQTIDKWKILNHCPNKGTITYQHNNATCTTYGPCKNKTEVTLCTINGMGHTWPGGNKKSRRFLGSYSNDLNANEAMWKFFQKHSLKN